MNYTEEARGFAAVLLQAIEENKQEADRFLNQQRLLELGSPAAHELNVRYVGYRTAEYALRSLAAKVGLEDEIERLEKPAGRLVEMRTRREEAEYGNDSK